MIQRMDYSGSPASTNFHVWGQDLSGTLEGAGGIGGLLAQVRGTNVWLYTYDGNGNVVDVLDATLLDIPPPVVAHYEYDPFGRVVSSSGLCASSNLWQFSTKPFNRTWGLVHYEFRPYSPNLHIWISRDPMGEKGSEQLKSISVAYVPQQLSKREIALEYHLPVEAILDTREQQIVSASGSKEEWEDANPYSFVANMPNARIDFLGLHEGYCRYRCRPTRPYDSHHFFFRFHCAYKDCRRVIYSCSSNYTCPATIDNDFIAVLIGPFAFCPGGFPQRPCSCANP